MKENERDTILLYEYLCKIYNKQKAKDLIAYAQDKKSNKTLFDGTKSLAYAVGKRSFEFFNLYFLQDLLVNGDDKYPLSQTHYEIWEELENAILNKSYDQLAYICPRSFGKTNTISVPLAIWCAVYGFKNYIVLSSATGGTATQFVGSIKTNIQDNSYIKRVFGQLIDSKKYIVTQEKVQLTNKCCIESISASGAIRGKQNELTNKRIELLICDDYQTEEETATQEQRDKKWKRFNADAAQAMQKNNSTIIGCGTVQHKECFYSRLVDSATWKSRVEKGILVDDIDELFNSGFWLEYKNLLLNTKDNNSLDTAKEFYLQNKEQMQFPRLWEYFDCQKLANAYYTNKETFLQEVQNDVYNVGQKKFTTIVTQSPEEIESNTFDKTILVIDPAGTRNKGNKKDYYAFIVGSSDNKIKYVRKGEIYKFEFEDYLTHAIELLKRYSGITHIIVEKNTYSGADVLRLQELIKQDPELKLRNLTFINEHQNQNKDAKINSIVGLVNLGQVILNEEDTEAIQQLSEFCGTKFSANDDFADCLAEFLLRIDKIETIHKLEFMDIKKLF